MIAFALFFSRATTVRPIPPFPSPPRGLPLYVSASKEKKTPKPSPNRAIRSTISIRSLLPKKKKKKRETEKKRALNIALYQLHSPLTDRCRSQQRCNNSERERPNTHTLSTDPDSLSPSLTMEQKKPSYTPRQKKFQRIHELTSPCSSR